MLKTELLSAILDFLLLIQGRKMTVDFREIKALAGQNTDLTLSETLESKRPQYRDVIPEEILELLEESLETYAMLAPSLPPTLQDIAVKEIEFFMSLYQDKSKDSLHIQNLQPHQKLLDRAEAISAFPVREAVAT